MFDKIALYIFTLITFATNAIGITQPSPSPTPTTIATSSPVATTVSKKTVVNNDPIVNCGPGQISKQYVKDKTSNCKNYVDCGLNNNTVYTMMLKTECDKKHSETNQKNDDFVPYTGPNTYSNPVTTISCVVSWPCTGKVQTYQVDQSTCNYMQSGALNTCKTADAIKEMNDIAHQPLPTIVVKPIDATIHFAPTTPPIVVPVGYPGGY